MTEPTDHRAEAEAWLEAAQDGYFLTEPDQRRDGWATTAALLAIAHDLHRIADALEYEPDDQPGPGNVEADYTDDGQIVPGSWSTNLKADENGVCT